MASSLLIAFENLPRERELISRMILAYGELEFAMLDILGAVFKNGQTAVRTLYRLRSEANRLDVFEAIATPWFERAGMHGHFKEGIDAVSRCKAIRNQYAHCTFIQDDGLLRFAQLEETAQSKGPVCQVVARPITLSLLEKQAAYFDYADHQILWLNYTYRVKNDQPVQVSGKIPKPQRLTPPKLHSRGEAHPLR